MTQSDDTKIDALFAALFGHWVRNLCCNFWCNFLGVNDPPECTSINGNEHFGTEFIASLKMLKEHLLFFLLDELSAFCYYVILIYRQRGFRTIKIPRGFVIKFSTTQII